MDRNRPRAAIFLDFENLYSTLKSSLEQGCGDYGQSPSINFGSLVDYVESKFGSLDRKDFIVAANFSHYNQQLGGLNRMATLVEVDSFESRCVRNQVQPAPGKRYVIKNYSDMTLAFLAGIHVAVLPADVYIFVTGDKAFAAVGSMIQSVHKKQVVFIFPQMESAGGVLTERFTWMEFKDTQPNINLETYENGEDTGGNALVEVDPYLDLRNHISNFRREFCSAIPVVLVRAVMDAENPQKLLDQARTNSIIDIWQNPDGVSCVSFREERLAGKIVMIDLRPSLEGSGQLLLNIKEIGRDQQKVLSRAEWRTKIRENSRLSNSEAKIMVDLLFATAILRDGSTNKPSLKPEKVITFIRQAENNITLP